MTFIKNKKDLQPPELTYCTFFRNDLRRIIIGKGDDGFFYTQTTHLDRETLKFSKSPLSVFHEESLKAIVKTYLEHYTDIGKMTF